MGPNTEGVQQSRFANPRQFGIDLCRAVGLDPKLVRSLTIDIEPGHVPMLRAEQYLSPEVGQRVVAVMKRYEIHPVGQENDVTAVGDQAKTYEVG